MCGVGLAFRGIGGRYDVRFKHSHAGATRPGFDPFTHLGQLTWHLLSLQSGGSGASPAASFGAHVESHGDGPEPSVRPLRHVLPSGTLSVRADIWHNDVSFCFLEVLSKMISCLEF